MNNHEEQGRVHAFAQPEMTSAPATTCLVPVILCGGSGARLWPVSRSAMPKQFLPLVSSRSMLEQVVLMLELEAGVPIRLVPPLVLCNESHRAVTVRQLHEAGLFDAELVFEPEVRNSAAAAAAAASIVASRDPDALLWIIPSNSVVSDIGALQRLLPIAASAARRQRIVAFGARPGAGDGGFGLLGTGAPLLDLAPVRDVIRFEIEPLPEFVPDLPGAPPQLLNTGMYVAEAAVLQSELAASEPAIVDAALAALGSATRSQDGLHLGRTAFASAPERSLEQVLATRSRRVAVVTNGPDVTEVSGWDAVWRVSPKDLQGNVALGDALLVDSEQCYVRSDGPLTAVLGLSDAVVVVTRDAVLAMHRDRARDLGYVVEQLRRRHRVAPPGDRRVQHAWGFDESLAREDRYRVTRFRVEPGASRPVNRRLHRDAHWVMVAGAVQVVRDGVSLILREGDSLDLLAGCAFSVHNPGRIAATLIDVQLGSYLEDDDALPGEPNEPGPTGS